MNSSYTLFGIVFTGVRLLPTRCRATVQLDDLLELLFDLRPLRKACTRPHLLVVGLSPVFWVYRLCQIPSNADFAVSDKVRPHTSDFPNARRVTLMIAADRSQPVTFFIRLAPSDVSAIFRAITYSTRTRTVTKTRGAPDISRAVERRHSATTWSRFQRSQCVPTPTGRFYPPERCGKGPSRRVGIRRFA